MVKTELLLSYSDILPGVRGCKAMKFFSARLCGVSTDIDQLLHCIGSTKVTFELKVLCSVSIVYCPNSRRTYLELYPSNTLPSAFFCLSDELPQHTAGADTDRFFGFWVQE